MPDPAKKTEREPMPLHWSTKALALVLSGGFLLTWSLGTSWQAYYFRTGGAISETVFWAEVLLSICAMVVIAAIWESFARAGWQRTLWPRITFAIIGLALAVFNFWNEGFPYAATYTTYDNIWSINHFSVALNSLCALFIAAGIAWLFKLIVCDRSERGRFRIHLSTAFVMMIAASLIVLANVTQNVSYAHFDSGSHLTFGHYNLGPGWPFVFHINYYGWPEFNWRGLMANILVAILILSALAVIFETIARRRRNG